MTKLDELTRWTELKTKLMDRTETETDDRTETETERTLSTRTVVWTESRREKDEDEDEDNNLEPEPGRDLGQRLGLRPRTKNKEGRRYEAVLIAYRVCRSKRNNKG